MFVPGNNPRQSLRNFYAWLDLVYDSHGFSCNYKIKSSDETFFIKGAYHHTSGEELNEFLKVLNTITELWTLECLRAGLSCGAVLRSSHSEKRADFLDTTEDWAHAGLFFFDFGSYLRLGIL